MKLAELKEKYEIRKKGNRYQSYRILSVIDYLGGPSCRTLKEARDQCRGDADHRKKQRDRENVLNQ